MPAGLADDMGLGKTIQVLALLLCGRDAGEGQRAPALLVVPASLLGNWRAEAERFAPSLKLCFLHPAENDRQTLGEIAAAPQEHLAAADLAVTTYTMLVRQTWLAELHWRLVILDEAQAIRNPATRQSRAARRLAADARIALTGTPVENRLGDLWALFDFLNPGLLGSRTVFGTFVKSLQARPEQLFAPLRRLVSPYILRRLKTDRSIIADLPEKTETDRYCHLTRAQVRLYQQVVQALQRGLESSEGIERRGLVLGALLRLKQVCNHPSQLSGDGEYAPAGSGKFLRLAELCEELAARQERVLIFTQYREIIDPLAEYAATLFGRAGLVLHGGTGVGERRAVVERFQADDGPPFLILSLKAGGTGLNLTAASHVIHFDRWWNPAVENQATDRAFRIGQRRNVLVHKFITRGTVEERIDAMIADKRQLAEDVLGGDQEVTSHRAVRRRAARPGPSRRNQRRAIGSCGAHAQGDPAPRKDRRPRHSPQLLGQALVRPSGVVLGLRQPAAAGPHVCPQRRDPAPGGRRGPYPSAGERLSGEALPGHHSGEAAPGGDLEGDPECMLGADRFDPGVAPGIAFRPRDGGRFRSGPRPVPETAADRAGVQLSRLGEHVQARRGGALRRGQSARRQPGTPVSPARGRSRGVDQR